MNQINLLIYLSTFVASAYLGSIAFRNRSLPISRPFVALAGLWVLSSLTHIIEFSEFSNNQWLSQFFLDFNLFLMPFIAPLWCWMLLEYYYEDKIRITDKRIIITSIQSFIVWGVVVADILSNGFLSQESPSALIQTAERLGDYKVYREVYSAIISAFFIILTVYLIIKKQHNSLWNRLQVIIYTPIPVIFYFLHYYQWTDLRLVPPSSIAYLYWINYQYRLLNIMPVALETIIDNIDSGVLVSNLRSKLLYINEHAHSLLDLKLSKTRNHQIPRIIEEHFDCLSNKKQTAQLIIESGQKNTQKLYIDAMLQPLLHPKTARHIGAAILLHDVTLRKQTELKLQNFDQQKSKFFAGISHEFRTPLTLSLGGLSNLLNNINHIDKEELKSSLKNIEANNNKLLNLVNQLLELSQLESGNLKIKPEKVSLTSYLPSVIANFETLAKQQNIQIHLLIDSQLQDNLLLYFDINAFDKIMLNLLSNAFKSMPSGGDIYLQLQSLDTKWLQLSIRDTGCGIAEDDLPTIFEMFYSHESTHSNWPQGAGVGLSVVKQLLAQHGAKIDVSSTKNQGSIFTLHLRQGYAHFTKGNGNLNQKTILPTQKAIAITPFDTIIDDNTIDNSAALNQLKQETTDLSSEKSEKLVLLVEDNAEMRTYIRQHLAIDFRLIEAADGEEALALAKQTLPDLVLSDVMMPKMDGYELCKQLKNNIQTSHIPILLLTAKSSQNEKLTGLSLGADDYLSKPFNTKELTTRMHNLIFTRQKVKAFYQENGLQRAINNKALPKHETTFLSTLQKYVRKNISQTDIKVSDLAKIVHMSERNLNRKVKSLTGNTCKKMLLLIRLEYAEDHLSNTDAPVTQISYRAGFSDPSHFARNFKAHYSKTPTEYRKSLFKMTHRFSEQIV